ncbi:MAG: cyclophilin-like fold protein [Nitrosopumilus sp.]|nr:cyclophilin-like fold protein [Nitrosopumilus sp.]MDH3340891.1 cyclophilin-like fold protein [Nitrosopumilus sp.]
MKHIVEIKIPNSSTILLELDDENSPKTVNEFIKKLPFTVDLNVWGDEIYTSKSPISQSEENAKSPVQLNDVAFWPTGKAICLFYGPTPIGKPGEITPASPVNVIGKIVSPDKSILNDVDSKRATFSLKS